MLYAAQIKINMIYLTTTKPVETTR